MWYTFPILEKNVVIPQEIAEERLESLYSEVITKLITYFDMPYSIEKLKEWFDKYELPTDDSATHTQLQDASGLWDDPVEVEKFIQAYKNYVFHYNKYINEQKKPKELLLIQEQINYIVKNANQTKDIENYCHVWISWTDISLIVSKKAVKAELKNQQEELLQQMISDKVIPSVIKQFEEFFESKWYIYDRPMTQQEFIDTCPDKDDPIKVENWKTAYTKEYLEYKPMKERHEDKEHIKFKIEIIDWLEWVLNS